MKMRIPKMKFLYQQLSLIRAFVQANIFQQMPNKHLHLFAWKRLPFGYLLGCTVENVEKVVYLLMDDNKEPVYSP